MDQLGLTLTPVLRKRCSRSVFAVWDGNENGFVENTFASGRRGMQRRNDRIAQSADLSARQPPASPAAYAPQAVNWTGFYIAAHAESTDPVSAFSNNLCDAGY